MKARCPDNPLIACDCGIRQVVEEAEKKIGFKDATQRRLAQEKMTTNPAMKALAQQNFDSWKARIKATFRARFTHPRIADLVLRNNCNHIPPRP